ncbi:hypothetical protein K474DRAFT_1662998 [Panus rudis PR-1116 ss-1]|nr:hypothetical protein K474DRAFT_1662998 [Panus rudis PR-1116 ss-1]
MSVSSRYGRATSPPASTAFSTNTAGQQRTNIVTRLVIEGSAKRSDHGRTDGAKIRMYLKLSVPTDSATPGGTIPLFPEENLKILESYVHPLDPNSAPYKFSDSSPELQKAARALKLPARNSRSYASLFESVAASTSSSSSSIAPVDKKYTGEILVTRYQVSFVLPREFPPRMDESSTSSRSSARRMSIGASQLQFMAAVVIWVPFLTKPPHSPYLLSIPIPRCLHNQIKLRIFPPSASTNNTSSLASLSSAEEEATTWDLASEPHVTRTTSPSKRNPSPYRHFADDESSDSSTTGFPDGCGIQGTFQSADRIRIRWAKPMRSANVPESADGRKRVGIEEVDSVMTCTVLGKTSTHKSKRRGAFNSSSPEGLRVKLEYNATCKGVWFPGVATLLGMDVGLDTGDSEVLWDPHGEKKWSITGGSGFTGYAIGSPSPSPSRQSSTSEQPSIYVLPSSPDGRPSNLVNGNAPPLGSRQNSTSSDTASLLRAPLPNQTVADYSFESSPSTTPVSSIASLATMPSSPDKGRRSRANSFNNPYAGDTDIDDPAGSEVKSPKIPVTLHVNMNEILPPAKNIYTFSISGTVVVYPKEKSPITPRFPNGSSHHKHRTGSDGEDDGDGESIILPRFKVFHADRETTNTLVRNELQDYTIDIYKASADVSDPRQRMGIIQTGGQMKCGNDAIKVIVKPSVPAPSSRPSYRSSRSTSTKKEEDTYDNSDIFGAGGGGRNITGSRPQTPNGHASLSRAGSSSALRQSYFLNASLSASRMMRPLKRNGPLMIPSVNITVSPLPPTLGGTEVDGGVRRGRLPRDYVVRMTLPAPIDTESEWLEFGLALPPQTGSSASPTIRTRNSDETPPRVEIASASIEGVPVKCEATAAVQTEKTDDNAFSSLGVSFEETSAREWVTWVKVHIWEVGGGNVEVVYIVRNGRGGSDNELDGVKEKGMKRSWWKGKWRASPDDGNVEMNFLLPTFTLPIGMLEVHVENQDGSEISSLRSNFSQQQVSPNGRHLKQYAVEQYFYPRLIATISPSPLALSFVPSSTFPKILWRILQLLFIGFPYLLALFLFTNQLRLAGGLAACSNALAQGCPEVLPPPAQVVYSYSYSTVTQTATVTATVTAHGDSKQQKGWWHHTSSADSEATTTISKQTTSKSETSTSTTSTPTTTETNANPIPTVTPVVPPPSAPSPKPTSITSLLSPRDISLVQFLRRWGLTDEHAASARTIFEYAAKGFGFAYRIWKRVANFPLEPPE